MSETAIQQFTGSLGGVNELSADQKFQLVQTYLSLENTRLQHHVELAKVNAQSTERQQQQQIVACLVPWKQRRLEARIFGFVIFAVGCILAYETYKTTDILTKFIAPFVSALQRPLLPGWEYYLFSESSWISGYAASIANGVLRFVLFVGCAGKRILLMPFNVLLAVASTSSSTAAGFIMLVFILLTMIIMKLYHSDIYVGLTSVSVKQSAGVELKKLQ
jgi:hypothetical protein